MLYLPAKVSTVASVMRDK